MKRRKMEMRNKKIRIRMTKMKMIKIKMGMIKMRIKMKMGTTSRIRMSRSKMTNSPKRQNFLNSDPYSHKVSISLVSSLKYRASAIQLTISSIPSHLMEVHTTAMHHLLPLNQESPWCYPNNQR